MQGKVNITEVECETFCARHDPKREAWLQQERAKWRKVHEESIARCLESAAGRPVVRRHTPYWGECEWLGVLVKETDCYYFFEPTEVFGLRGEDRHGWDPKSNKIWKAKAHITPCKSCGDHPETNFPAGGWAG